MKKVLLLFTLFVLSWNCSKKEGIPEGIECDAGYEWFFVIKNGTGDKEIEISTDYQWGTGYPKQITLAPNDNAAISEVDILGPCGAKEPMEELMLGDNFYVHPIDLILSGPDQFFTMTVDGVEVSHEIWNIKYWPFEADPSDFYKAYYTLTVTDELLDSLPPPDNEN